MQRDLLRAAGRSLQERGLLQAMPQATTLVVFVAGFNQKEEEFLDIEDALREQYTQADIFEYRYANSMFTAANPFHLAVELEGLIQSYCTQREVNPNPSLVRVGPDGYREILLIGYGAGALLARAAFVIASGISLDGSKTATREWPGLVQRMVFLAGMHRGWSIRNKLGQYRELFDLMEVFQPLLSFGAGLCNLPGFMPLWRQFERGAPFVVATRTAWLQLAHQLEQQKSATPTQTAAHVDSLPVVVQLLGQEDEIVDAEDCLDLDISTRCVLRRLALTNHDNIIQFKDGSAGERRRGEFLSALTHPLQDLHGNMSASAHLIDSQVTCGVLFAHSLLPKTFEWDVLETALGEQAKEQQISMKLFSSGHLLWDILDFIWEPRCRGQVRLWADRIVNWRARYPNAQLVVIGHGIGAYFLARAFLANPSLQVQRLLMLAAPVRRDYPWERMHQLGQVELVAAQRAPQDKLLGILPAGPEALWRLLGRPVTVLGSAGGNGFEAAIVRHTEMDGGFSGPFQGSRPRELAQWALGQHEALGATAARRTRFQHLEWKNFSGFLLYLLWIFIFWFLVWFGAVLLMRVYFPAPIVTLLVVALVAAVYRQDH